MEEPRSNLHVKAREMTCALRDVEDLPFSHLQTQLADQIGWLASGNELKVFECFSRVGVAIINLFP
jgi:hypothetical protein